MKSHTIDAASVLPHEINKRLFDDLLDDGLIEPREHARAVKRPLEYALCASDEALAVLVWRGVVSRKRFATLAVRAHAERRLLRGQERLRIVQSAKEQVEQMDREREAQRAIHGRSTLAWLGDMVLGLCVVFVFLI